MSEVKITVITVKGAREVVKAPLDLTLAEFRKKIRGHLDTTEVFLDQDGKTQIRFTQEPNLTVADIVAGEPPYEVRIGRGRKPQVAGTEVEIRLGGTAVATLHDVDPEQTLAELRTRLGDDVPATARFQRGSGTAVAQGDEERVRVKDVLAGTVIHLSKPTERTRVEDRNTPDRPDLNTSGTLESTAEETIEDRTGEALPSLDSATSQGLVPWGYMKPADRKKILDRFTRDFQRPLGLGPNGLEPTWQRIGWVDPIFADLEPPTRLRRQSLVTFDREVHEVLKVKTLEANGELGVPGLGEVKAGYSETAEEKDLAQHTKLYVLDKFVIPKVALRIPLDAIRIPESFANDVEKAVRHDNVDAYIKLVKVLNEFGYWVPTAWVLGGTVYAEQIVDIDKTTSIKKVTKACSAAFSANLSSMGVPATAGGSGGYGSGETTTDTREHHSRTDKLIAIGGDPATVGSRGDYIASLSPYKSWEPIDYTELHPTLSFLQESVRNTCVRLVNSHAYKAAARRLTEVDMRSYVQPLMLASIPDDW